MTTGDPSNGQPSLTDLRRAVKALEKHDERREELLTRRDQLVRSLLHTYGGPRLAKIVGVSPAYLYKIRDKAKSEGSQ